MTLLEELQDLRAKAAFADRLTSDRQIKAEWEMLVTSLREFPLLSFNIWKVENAERANNEGLLVRYCGDIIPQWEVSIPEEINA